MVNIRRRLAEDIGIQPAYVEGLEEHGLCYFLWPESSSVGVQCKYCNTILWVDSRENKILSEPKPHDVPEYGDGYRNYHKEKLERFLQSLPSCPDCGKRVYDKFINNVSFPRFSDGLELDDRNGDIELKNVDPGSVEVWWVDND
jgi:hypothetical protein